VLDMSMSLDGFIAGPDDNAPHGLGVNGQRLHAWLAAGSGDDPRTFQPSGPSGAIFDQLMATGAVLVGRRTFDLAGRWNGDDRDGCRSSCPRIIHPTTRRRDWLRSPT
jgi:dihydrofolate reductase